MAHTHDFWRLDQLSDAQLLESLGGVLRTQQRSLAELAAHLGEVEDRRLHLTAAFNSMFAYCVTQLGMSEDEACRRIELARLARRFPALFAELASGRISLSVALLLKSVLSPSNHLELICAVRGKCIREARELLAERFPQPDTPSSIRKLPARRPNAAVDPDTISSRPPLSAGHVALPSLAVTSRTGASCAPNLPAVSSAQPDPPVLSTPPLSSSPDLPATSSPLLSSAPCPPAPSAPTLPPPAFERPSNPAAAPASSTASHSRGTIEPLSALRYRIQFTADADVKKKLELARELLRHAHPAGDFAPVISRALDLLIEDLLRRRFGAKSRRNGARSESTASTGPQDCKTSEAVETAGATPEPTVEALGATRESTPDRPLSPTSEPARSAVQSTVRTTTTTKPRPHISRVARRAVLERDGLGCSWVDEHGMRCGSRAWLEFDHRQPAGKRGRSEPDNLRLLCRAHNGLAAERAYGREHIERMSALRRKTARSADPSA